VAAAMQANIPVVVFDSALNGQPGKDFLSFVATDNHHGGQMAGEQLAKLLGGKGKVVLLRYAVGSASTEAREAGFMDVMKQNPGITMISDDHFAGPTVASAKDQAMQLIDKLKDADGIFTPNESSTLGMFGALKDNGLIGKVKFVGFDASDELIKDMQSGGINALVAQNPENMGYMAVKTCVDHIHGQQVPATIDTGAKLITPESLSDPETRKFLHMQ
jgi:ribose transport system substrate-binding protein